MESLWKIGRTMLNGRSMQSESSQKPIVARYGELIALLLSLHERLGPAYKEEDL